MKHQVWEVKIGGNADDLQLPAGADSPMRDAVYRAYRELTGRDPEFCFSGWGGSLTAVEQQIVQEHAAPQAPEQEP